MKYYVSYIWDTAWHPKICVLVFVLVLSYRVIPLGGIKEREGILAIIKF